MTLHYLNNRVDVELHLDQQRYTDRVTATNLQTQLTKLTTHLPWVNRITVWYG